MRRPLKLIKEKYSLETSNPENLLDYVTKFRNRIAVSNRTAKEHLGIAQGRK